ncbi:hypothetical protein [Actinoplanes sp. M2I2]|uniref:hypothetical protein n=1 Tax=Actinoplanes sp. M2I2 TaxID=1734444 RepID=UPI0020201EEB|nr:hypothetical protein [Actinoplanes sp. M2I2]
MTDARTGAQVLLCEPSKWGRRLTKMDFDLVRRNGRWTVVTKSGTTLNATVEAGPRVLAAVRAQHDKTVAELKTQVCNAQPEIRQLLIEWARTEGATDPADFFVKNGQLVRDGVPVAF